MADSCEFCASKTNLSETEFVYTLCAPCHREMHDDRAVACARNCFEIRKRVYERALTRAESEAYIQQTIDLVREAREHYREVVRAYADPRVASP